MFGESYHTKRLKEEADKQDKIKAEEIRNGDRPDDIKTYLRHYEMYKKNGLLYKKDGLMKDNWDRTYGGLRTLTELRKHLPDDCPIKDKEITEYFDGTDKFC